MFILEYYSITGALGVFQTKRTGGTARGRSQCCSEEGSREIFATPSFEATFSLKPPGGGVSRVSQGIALEREVAEWQSRSATLSPGVSVFFRGLCEATRL